MDIETSPKLHLNLRPAEPDHPMVLDGEAADGDVELMLRCMAEEFFQVGVSCEELMRLCRNAAYPGLYLARQQLGDARTTELILQTHARVGRHRFHTIEHQGDVKPATLTVGQSGRKVEHA